MYFMCPRCEGITHEHKTVCLPCQKKLPNVKDTNKEGLTWSEWLRATGITIETLAKQRKAFGASAAETFTKLRLAWMSGEDPTEHR